jgi:hypothetical protein
MRTSGASYNDSLLVLLVVVVAGGIIVMLLGGPREVIFQTEVLMRSLVSFAAKLFS